MNKAKKAVLIFCISAALVLAFLFILSAKTTNLNLPNDKIIFYYGITCPHCKLVEDYMENNSIESILPIVKKEVYLNQTNADELLAIGKKFNLPQEEIGAVPLAYYNGQYYIGDEPVINFLKQKAKEVAP